LATTTKMPMGRVKMRKATEMQTSMRVTWADDDFLLEGFPLPEAMVEILVDLDRPRPL
jgi:hypothetical protein